MLEEQPDLTREEIMKTAKMPLVPLRRVSCDDDADQSQNESETIEDTQGENINQGNSDKKSSGKLPRKGRSPMVLFMARLYRERKADTDNNTTSEKTNRDKKVTRRALPPPHYDHWDLDHVPLQCSQCDAVYAHEVMKQHYKSEHQHLFPTAFDIEARQKRKKYSVFICPCTGCGFTTYWEEVIQHHTKGHKMQRQEMEGLTFALFGTQTATSSRRGLGDNTAMNGNNNKPVHDFERFDELLHEKDNEAAMESLFAFVVHPSSYGHPLPTQVDPAPLPSLVLYSCFLSFTYGRNFHFHCRGQKEEARS